MKKKGKREEGREIGGEKREEGREKGKREGTKRNRQGGKKKERWERCNKPVFKLLILEKI